MVSDAQDQVKWANQRLRDGKVSRFIGGNGVLSDESHKTVLYNQRDGTTLKVATDQIDIYKAKRIPPTLQPKQVRDSFGNVTSVMMERTHSGGGVLYSEVPPQAAVLPLGVATEGQGKKPRRRRRGKRGKK